MARDFLRARSLYSAFSATRTCVLPAWDSLSNEEQNAWYTAACVGEARIRDEVVAHLKKTLKESIDTAFEEC